MPVTRSTRADADPSLRPAPNPAFDAWIDSFRGRARAKGLSETTVSEGLRGVGFLPGVVERDRNQTEFRRPLQDYLAIVAPEEKVALGRQKYAATQSLLTQIEDRYGVPPNVVAAIWGVESYFGTRRGDIPVISATATLAFDGRRGAFFEAQLVSALKILQRGDTTPANLKGSWAGAMGHTQFIPTTYEAYAVDFRGDGRRDIWSEDPTDGLASAANYLARSGWRRGQPWGYEVRLPSGFDTGLAGRGKRRAAAEWAGLGVQAASGRMADHGPAALLVPAGATGPAFLVFRNFDVILRYNGSENYGLGVGYLSDRLGGGGPLRGAFPPDQYGLTIAERREIQTRLTQAGFDAGTADGVFGKKTEAAIRAYQTSRGMAVTGAPSRDLLERLRRG
nr:lytic murein transglycosylase [Thalassococcus arenae]